jgi:cellulose synthase/poly-beta-1,6-N-acetylglucosamine synthase-like glycosyltransferase
MSFPFGPTAHPSDLLLLLHLLLWALLAAYGLHRLDLIRLYRRRDAAQPPPAPAEWPRVTIQLPVRDERYVVERLLEAAASIDYPRDRFEIQLLDDSSDETTPVAAAAVDALRREGVEAVHIRREERRGYKAGALQYGLERARGELLAVFDADFVPPPSILRELVPYFQDPRVGIAQARWAHLNRDYSALSKAQAISLDGHFLIEHRARMCGGRYLNFNGTAGLLRKTCVVDAGGWQSDTLTEDLDLSYRAQLRGWRVVFAPHVQCPGELPVEMNAFKAQQYRWVKGSVQVARKLLPRIWRSRVPASVKWEATFHLTDNVVYVLLLLLSLIIYPVVLARYESRSLLYTIADLALLVAAAAPMLAFFACAQRESRLDWRRQLCHLPFVLSLGIGLAVNNTRAVVEGLVGPRGAFDRTPKFRIEHRGDRWWGKRYRAAANPWVLLELGLAAYFAFAIASLAMAKLYAPLPFFALYFFGYFYVGAVSLFHAARRD